MNIFSRRKYNNTAAGAIPAPAGQARPILQPGPTTIHNHGPNWIGIILGGTLAAMLILAGLWLGLVFLFYQMGAVNPWRDAAAFVIYGGLIAGGLWFLSFLIGPYFESNQSFKLEIAREITRREEVKLLSAQTAINPGRYNESDFEFARVILCIMMNAYEWLEKQKRDNFPGQSRPWSMDKSKEVADKIGVKMSQDKANSVSVWLFEEGIITAPERGQITPAFPTLSSVRAHLDNKYGKPIVVVSPTLRDNRGFKFTG